MIYTLLTPDRREHLVKRAAAVTRGCIAEVGVYHGGALVAMAEAAPNVQCYGFDTFTGIPPNFAGSDEKHAAGDFNDVNFEELRAAMAKYANVRLVQGLFLESAAAFDKVEFGLVHLDMDHWRGTLKALEWFWPRLVPGAAVVFDDYGWDKCPGIAVVVDTWADANHIPVLKTAQWQATLISP